MIFFNTQVYSGPHVSEKQIYLYYAANHFSVITSFFSVNKPCGKEGGGRDTFQYIYYYTIYYYIIIIVILFIISP